MMRIVHEWAADVTGHPMVPVPSTRDRTRCGMRCDPRPQEGLRMAINTGKVITGGAAIVGVVAAHRGGSTRDQHPLLPDGTLADWHGPRSRHVRASGHRRCDLPDHGEALPGPAVQQTRFDLELRSGSLLTTKVTKSAK